MNSVDCTYYIGTTAYDIHESEQSMLWYNHASDIHFSDNFAKIVKIEVQVELNYSQLLLLLLFLHTF